MPALQIDDAGVPDVASFGTLLNKLLVEAEAVKKVTTIEPALQKSQFDDLTGRVAACFARDGNAPDTQPAETSAAVARTRRNAIIETAARSLFDQLIVWTPITCLNPGLELTHGAGVYVDRLSRFRPDVELPRPSLYSL